MIASEYPLKKESYKPSNTINNSPVRLSYINKQTLEYTKQYGYLLEKTAVPTKAKKSKDNNGLIDTLALNPIQLFTLEPSYTIGKENIIRLFTTSAEETTTSLINIDSLVKTEFMALKKNFYLILNPQSN